MENVKAMFAVGDRVQYAPHFTINPRIMLVVGVARSGLVLVEWEYDAGTWHAAAYSQDNLVHAPASESAPAFSVGDKVVSKHGGPIMEVEWISDRTGCLYCVWNKDGEWCAETFTSENLKHVTEDMGKEEETSDEKVIKSWSEEEIRKIALEEIRKIKMVSGVVTLHLP